jgi:hypothetical protein
MEIRIQSDDRLCGRNLLSVLKSMSLSSRMIKYLKYRDDGISRPLFLTGTLSKSIQYQLEASDGSVVWREEPR